MKKIITILLFIISCQTIAMTTREEEIICPIGGEHFIFYGMGSGTAFGRMLDFQPFGAIETPWPIAKCPNNGLIVYHKFTQEHIKKLETYVLSKTYQDLQKKESSYYLLYILMSQLSFPKEDQIRTLLSATWQVSGETYNRYATELLYLMEKLEVEPVDPYHKLIEIELNRRIGNFSIANLKIEKFKQNYFKSIEKKDLDYFKKYLRQQQKLIRNKNSNMSEFKNEN